VKHPFTVRTLVAWSVTVSPQGILVGTPFVHADRTLVALVGTGFENVRDARRQAVPRLGIWNIREQVRITSRASWRIRRLRSTTRARAMYPATNGRAGDIDIARPNTNAAPDRDLMCTWNHKGDQTC